MTLVNVKVYIKPLCLSLLLITILKLLTNMHWLPFILSCAWVLFTAMIIYSRPYTRVIDFVWEILFAFSGLFIGFYIEFGITDIHAFYELCGQGNMTAIAPITIKGMFIGCNIGMLLSKKSQVKVPHLLSFNLGMLVGMSVFEHIDSVIVLTNAPLSMFIHLVTMIIFGHIFYMVSTSFNYRNAKGLCFVYLKLAGGK